MEKTSEILKNLRIESGLTQKDLAQKLNIGQSTIVGYEKGEREATATNLTKYANFFNLSVDYLLGRTDELGGTILSPANSSPLSADEQKLLNGFRSLSKSTQEMLLRVLDNAVKAESRA